MLYAALAFWILMILFAGVGIYRLWSRLVRPAWVNWLLLPGTVVSEMAYILGSLLTGGEVHAKLIDSPSRPRARRRPSEVQPQAGAATKTTGGLKVIGPILASLVAVVACAAAILAVDALLDAPIIADFRGQASPIAPAQALRQAPQTLPQALPLNWGDLWGQVQGQVNLLRRMCETLAMADWLNWRVPVFVYLAMCLSIRLAPVSRPMRPTLAGAVVMAAGVAGVGAISGSFADAVTDIWPLLTFVWASLLLLLVLTALILALRALVRILAGKEPTQA